MPTLLGNLLKLEQYAKLPEAKWCDTVPWQRQRAFLDLGCLEALYGGAAGGGKSDALLRAALQYVHVPGYSALILRTDFQRLSLSGGLIPRSQQWLIDKAKWNGGNFRWHFPSGASVQFGYLSNSMDKYRYGSSEYQFIAFDELTEFAEDDYTFMFSRLRKTTDIDVPYRIRSASNPGGRGHEWVKARFVTAQAEEDLKTGQLKLTYESPDGRVFVPAKVRDNPAVNPVLYTKNLMHLNPVERERLMNGDWTIMPTGLFRESWLRYYTTTAPRGGMICLLKSEVDREGNIVHTDDELVRFLESDCSRIITVDAAGGVEQIEQEKRGKKLSYTAVGVWDRWGGNDGTLVLRHVRRGRGLNYVAMRDMVAAVIEEWGGRTYIEDKAMGMALVADLGGRYNVEAIGTQGEDKVGRCSPFLNMASEGRVYLPKYESSWRPAYEGEVLRWQGLKDETNDQVDISAYAALASGGFSGGVVRASLDPRVDTMSLKRDRVPHLGGGLMAGWQ